MISMTISWTVINQYLWLTSPLQCICMRTCIYIWKKYPPCTPLTESSFLQEASVEFFHPRLSGCDHHSVPIMNVFSSHWLSWNSWSRAWNTRPSNLFQLGKYISPPCPTLQRTSDTNNYTGNGQSLAMIANKNMALGVQCKKSISKPPVL